MTLEEVIRTFDSHADDYDAWFRKGQGPLAFESEVSAIRRLLIDGLKMEVGVGTGVFAEALGVGVGLDPSLGVLRYAVARGIHAIRGVGEALPMRDSVAYCALLIVTVCFLKDPGQSLIEMRRILRADGCVIVGFIPRNSEWGRLYLKKKQEGHRFYRHAHFFTLDEVRATLEKASLSVDAWVSTLRQSPGQVKVVEEPVSEGSDREYGFQCVRARFIAR